MRICHMQRRCQMPESCHDGDGFMFKKNEQKPKVTEVKPFVFTSGRRADEICLEGKLVPDRDCSVKKASLGMPCGICGWGGQPGKDVPF
jgi:hypothetical protein